MAEIIIIIIIVIALAQEPFSLRVQQIAALNNRTQYRILTFAYTHRCIFTHEAANAARYLYIVKIGAERTRTHTRNRSERK